MPSRKLTSHTTTSEISCCLKYVIFTFNVVFWMFGLGVLAVGIWAWTEKDIFNNLTKLTFVALDPAFVLICVGTVTFFIGFTGSVGALRENTCLLAAATFNKSYNTAEEDATRRDLLTRRLAVIDRNNQAYNEGRQSMGALVWNKYYDMTRDEVIAETTNESQS